MNRRQELRDVLAVAQLTRLRGWLLRRMPSRVKAWHAVKLPPRFALLDCFIVPRPGERAPLISVRSFGRVDATLDRYAIVPREWLDEREIWRRAALEDHKLKKKLRRAAT